MWNCSKGDETITARYAIDASRNNGMKQPFNQVVRKQDERKQMHGGNCPCCNGVSYSSLMFFSSVSN